MTCEQRKQADQCEDQPEENLAHLCLALKTPNPEVETALLATGYGPCRRQHRFDFKTATDIETDLPAGDYHLEVVARHHQPAKLAVSLKAGRVTKRTVCLEPEEAPPVPSFKDRLKAYRLKPQQAVPELELKEREHRVVTNDKDQPGVIRLNARSLDDVKQFIGAPRGVFTDDTPVFEPVQVSKTALARLKKEVSREDRELVKSLVTEFLYGNEQAQADVMKALSPVLKGRLVAAFWVHLYVSLTIPAGATYEFGPGTLILDKLNIHKTGKLVSKGQCKFDIGHYEEFE